METLFDHDDNGNQTDRGNDIFEYDHENRLVESVIDSVTSTSVYNGDGLRTSHTVGQTTTSYIWDVAAGLPVVLQDGTNTGACPEHSRRVYGLDLISATDASSVQTYFLYDGLGSTADLTDGSGDVVDGYTYDVFGALRSGSPGATDFLFTGEQHDADSDMYYLRARYYDPAIGRFLGRDPLTGSALQPQTQNRYAYVENNPATLVDPSGMCPRAEGRGFSIDRDRLRALLEEYLACVKFGISLLAGYGGVWGFVGAVVATVVAEYAADEDHDPVYVGIAGAGAAGKKGAPTVLEEVIQSQLRARGLRNEAFPAIRATGDQLKALGRNYAIWLLRAYSAWGCARSLGIVH